MWLRSPLIAPWLRLFLRQVAEAWLWYHGLDEIWLVTGNDPSLRAYCVYKPLRRVLVGVETEGDWAGEMKFIKPRPLVGSVFQGYP